MADVEMTPITPTEGGSVPPKVAPFGAAPAAPAAAPAAVSPSAGVSTIKLKPVIRKPMIHKPVIGGAKPPAAAPAPAPAAAAAKKATQNLKSVTGPIPVQATLKKTGIIAEGIITPAQQQAAKSKTSRISLESAIGVAPVKDGPAPLKTIRLRRPTDLKPAAAPSPLAPKVAEPAAAAPAPAPAPIAAPKPVIDPIAVKKPEPLAPEAPAVGDDSSVTQKKTLKLHRPGSVGIKRPTLGPKPGNGGVGDMDAVGDIPDMGSIEPLDLGSAPSGSSSSGVPAWVAAISLIVTLAALLVAGFVMFNFWQMGTAPEGAPIGPNEMAFMNI